MLGVTLNPGLAFRGVLRKSGADLLGAMRRDRDRGQDGARGRRTHIPLGSPKIDAFKKTRLMSRGAELDKVAGGRSWEGQDGARTERNGKFIGWK